MKFLKEIISTLFVISLTLGYSNAQVSKTINPNQFFDGTGISGQGVNPFFTYTSGVDFPAGNLVTDVSISISWSRTEASCGGLDALNDVNEIGFVLRAPNGTSRTLAPLGSWSGNPLGTITTVYQNTGGAPSGLPVNGTFGSNQTLNSSRGTDFLGISPFGNWELFVIDNNGNISGVCVSSATLTVTACDPNPNANCQATLSRNLNASGTYTPVFADLDNGSVFCTALTTTTFSPTSLSCTDIGAPVPVTMTFTTEDALGNIFTDFCVTNVTVSDVTLPVARCQNISANLDATGNVTINATQLNNTVTPSTDNCSQLSYSFHSTSLATQNFNCNDIGVNNVLLRVTDPSGNFRTCGSSITISDNSNPVANCQNFTAYLDATGNVTVSASSIKSITTPCTDNCTISSLLFNATGLTTQSFNCTNLGANPVTLRVTDQSGNTATCLSTITVMDTINPVASCHNFSANLDATGNVTVNASSLNSTVTPSTDNCIINSLLFEATGLATQNFNCNDIGVNNVLLRVTDQSGNTSICAAVITISDIISPVANCQNITVYLDATGNVTLNANFLDNTVTPSSDNCSLLTFLFHASGLATQTYNCSNIGANPVMLSVIDPSGNTGVCGAIVTVMDSIVPTSNCRNINVFLQNGNVTINAIDLDSLSSDNCSIASYLFDATSLATETYNSAGIYYVNLRVTDIEGNVSGCAAQITVTDTCLNFNTNLIPVSPLCNGNSNGSIDLVINGGTAPYTFSWSNGNTTEDLTGLGSNMYVVSVTDTYGCNIVDSVLLQNQSAVLAQIIGTNLSCNGINDGVCETTILGGTAPFTFLWSNGATTQDVSGLAEGAYTLTVTDVNNCSISENVTITEPSHIASTINVFNPGCYGFSNGTADNIPSGGTPPYTYLWSNNETTEDATGLAAGNYELTITDANNCTNTFPFIVLNPAELLITNVPTTPSSCTGASDGSAQVLFSGGTAPYNFNWNNNASNQTSSSVTGLIAGSYMVTITDFNNCVDSASFFVNRQTNFSGRVVMDENNNCLIDANENGIIGTMIRIERLGGNSVFTNVYDSIGNFAVCLDSGSYIITLLPPNPYWQSCTGPQTINIDSICTQVNIEWVFQPTITCPLMTVDLNVPILRKTRPSFYHVNYCNTGNADAINASVQVTMDPFLNILSTSIPFVSQNGNVFNFNVGNVPVGKCGTFTIEVIVDTTAFSGQTHCSYAHAFPDSICIPNLWNGAILNTNANCNNDTVFFRIENNGSAMSNSGTYYILENDTIIVQDFVQLGNGSFLDIAQAAATGKTYRLIVKQESGYPELLGDSVSTVFIENCNSASGTNISRGYGLSFSNGDIAPTKAVDCAQNVSAYDPNDKRGQPVGYGANSYIYDYTTLEYTIRFQNMGNDTAFNVVILDTLNPFLDISSIVIGASSHNHVWQIIDGNVLRINFPDIKLTDTITNEPLSHGFIKYRIEQQAGNPLGTLIENRAGIYFDFEPVVITNTTRHIVNEGFEISLVSTEPILKENVSIQVFPNPFDNQTTIKVSGFDFSTLTLTVYDISGKLIREINGTGNQLQLSRDGLNQGLYFYKLSSEGELIQSGKVIVK